VGILPDLLGTSSGGDLLEGHLENSRGEFLGRVSMPDDPNLDGMELVDQFLIGEGGKQTRVGDIIPITEVPTGSELTDEAGRRMMLIYITPARGEGPVLVNITEPRGDNEDFGIATRFKPDTKVKLTKIIPGGWLRMEGVIQRRMPAPFTGGLLG
jgi:hypothetical protein